MPDVDPEEVVTAIKDGITVEKSFEPDDFPVPAIAFSISSDREESVTVRLVDTVPDDVAPENVGFHPKYGAEFWDVDGDEIVFEREFSPDEAYTTVYGLRGSDADVPAKFLSEPSIESVDQPIDGDDAGGATGVDASVAAVEADSHGETEAEATTDGSDAVDGDLGDEAIAPGIDHERGNGSDPHSVSVRADDSDLLSSLTAEIEAADPDDPAVSELRDALGIDLTRATVEARIEHLQSAVADLEAYTGALEAFLDENGDAQRLLDDLHDEYEETTSRLDDVESLAEEANESADSLDDRLDSEVDEIRAEIERIESDIEAFSGELSEVVEMRDRLTRALGGLAAEGAIDGGDAEPDDDADTDDTTASDVESSDEGSEESSEDAESDGNDEASDSDDRDDE